MSPRRSAAAAAGTRARIVGRGMVVASVEGLQGLTIGRLAADLGMSKAGVLGHFGTKQALQLAVLDAAVARFTERVWAPAAGRPAGMARLRAVCDAWMDYLEHDRDAFPGGCLFTTAAVEFDALTGPVHDQVARLHLHWRRRLAAEVRAAVRAGEVPADVEPEQVAFELSGLYLAFNQAVQLHADPEAGARTRRALDRLLMPARLAASAP